MENFVLYDEIGTGDNRTVYKARKKGTIEYVAVHCIDKSKRHLVKNNVRICHDLDHENVVLFREWYETSNHLWLVVELCTGVSLTTVLSQDSYLPEATVKSFGKDLVTGLAYLHSLDIVYADLNPSKILLAGDGILKYSNFSLARILGEPPLYGQSIDDSVSSTREDVLLSSPLYMAPEIVQGEYPSKCSDLWSLGCVLFEMFTGTPPFKAISVENLCQQIMEAKTPYPMQGQNGTYTKASENLFMLIQGLLQKDSSQRIDWLELCLHPFWDDELSFLADTFDNARNFSQNTLTTNSRCTSIMSNLADEAEEVGKKTLQSYGALELTESVMTDEDDDLTLKDSLLVGISQNNQEEKLPFVKVDSKNKMEQYDRPVTVPKQHPQRILQTTSLHIPDEKSYLTSSVQSEKASRKAAWQGTYKLERGLAIMDLTEVASHTNEVITPVVNPSYSKSRETKVPQVNLSKREIDLDESVNSANMLGLSEVIPSLTGLNINVLDHLYHASDLTVTPIAENNRLRKLPSLKWENNSLGFLPFTMEKLQRTRKDELKGHIVSVFSTYSQIKKNTTHEKTGLRQKMSILAYLNMAAKYEEVSNTIFEENLLKYFLNELKMPGQLDLKARIGRVLGVVASCVTYISPIFNMSEVFTVVTDQIKQNFRTSQIKQAFLPVLGEFLFYAATQEESENREFQPWEPSNAVFTMIIKCLQQTDDTITRHVATKIIENVTSTTARYCKKFLTNEVGLSLWNVFIHAASDMEKCSAASALCRISMHSPSVVQHVSDRAGFTSFQEGLFTGTAKSQQAFLTVFVSLLSSSVHAKKVFNDHKLISKVLQSIESATLVQRGKIYLFISEMCLRSHDVLLLCCEGRLVTYIERDSKKVFIGGKENKELMEYIHQCLTVVVNSITKALPKVIEGVLHILDVVSGRHHPNPAQVKQLKLHLPLLQIILYLITSSMFRRRIMDATFVQNLGDLLKKMQKIDTGEINLTSNATRNLSESMTSTIFSVVEAIAQHPPLLLSNQILIMKYLLPVLASFGQSENGNLRMLSWKLLSDMSTLFLDRVEGETPREKDKAAPSSDLLFQILQKYFIPVYDSLVQDQHPLPSYCLKLLHACTERYPSIVQNLLERDVISTLLIMLRSYQGDINSSVLQSIIGILNNIVANKDINFMDLCKRGLIDYISSTFIEVASAIEENTNSNTVTPLLLQLLDTLHHVLKNIEQSVKSVLTNKVQTSNTTSRQEVEELLQESKVLSELNGILINLLVYDDTDIQKWSCRCLYLSAELYGGEIEDCFTNDNIECLCQFLKIDSRKQQKIMLRIIKRLILSNGNLVSIFKKCTAMVKTLKRFVSLTVENTDDKTIKAISEELCKLLKLSYT